MEKTGRDHLGPFPWLLLGRRNSVGAPGVESHHVREQMAADYTRFTLKYSPAGASAMAAEGKRSPRSFRFCKFTRALARPMSFGAREPRSLNEIDDYCHLAAGRGTARDSKRPSPGPGVFLLSSGFCSCVLWRGSFPGEWQGSGSDCTGGF